MVVIKDERVAITVRIPKQLMDRAKALAVGSGSFNDLLVKALEREVRMRQAREAIKKADEFRERVYRDRGLSSDSTPYIRQLREGLRD